MAQPFESRDRTLILRGIRELPSCIPQAGTAIAFAVRDSSTALVGMSWRQGTIDLYAQEYGSPHAWHHISLQATHGFGYDSNLTVVYPKEGKIDVQRDGSAPVYAGKRRLGVITHTGDRMEVVMERTISPVIVVVGRGNSVNLDVGRLHASNRLQVKDYSGTARPHASARWVDWEWRETHIAPDSTPAPITLENALLCTAHFLTKTP